MTNLDLLLVLQKLKLVNLEIKICLSNKKYREFWCIKTLKGMQEINQIGASVRVALINFLTSSIPFVDLLLIIFFKFQQIV